MKRHVYLVSIVIGIVGGISIAIGVAKLALAPVFGIGIFGLGVLCLGWALTLIVVERLHREVVRREEAVPKASDRTAAGASKRRRRWGAIYALVAGMVATSLVVAIVIVVPAFQIQYDFIIPAPEIVSGPQDHVSVEGQGLSCVSEGQTPPSACGNTVLIGTVFQYTIIVADFSRGQGCNVTAISLNDSFRLLAISPRLPAFVAPVNTTTGISQGDDLTLEIQAPWYGGTVYTVGGVTVLACA